MSEPLILTERRGSKDGILWMTLNRPEKLNALTLPLLKEMRDVLVEARFDRSIRCIVVTGAGRGFCAGMDMGGNADPDREPRPARPGAVDPEGYRLGFRHETETYVAMRRVEVPIVAMINGPAVGAGFDLASHCDLAVGSTAARYQVAYVKRGVYPGHGGFWSLPKILGWRKAMELMMTGRFMGAEEAHEGRPDQLPGRASGARGQDHGTGPRTGGGPAGCTEARQVAGHANGTPRLRYRNAMVRIGHPRSRLVTGFGRRHEGVWRTPRNRLPGTLEHAMTLSRDAVPLKGLSVLILGDAIAARLAGAWLGDSGAAVREIQPDRFPRTAEFSGRAHSSSTLPVTCMPADFSEDDPYRVVIGSTQSLALQRRGTASARR